VKVTPCNVMDCESERATYEPHVRKNILKFGQADNTESSRTNAVASDIHDSPYVGLLWLSKLSFKIAAFKFGSMNCSQREVVFSCLFHFMTSVLLPLNLNEPPYFL
jgi:hypothetical protein